MFQTFGCLPCLKDHSNGLELVETGAMLRYLARKHGLDGSDDVERAKIDMVNSASYDVLQSLVKAVYAGLIYGDSNHDYVSTTSCKPMCFCHQSCRCRLHSDLAAVPGVLLLAT